jgi:uncharacterized Zn finger protein
MARHFDRGPYVPVDARRDRNTRVIAARRSRGEAIDPVIADGPRIAQTFWGKSWCTHLESYSDYATRLPRGRSYLRLGAVIHLGLTPGRIDARVQGSELYTVTIDVVPLDKARWDALVGACRGQIDSAVALLQGQLGGAVMRIVTDRSAGLFPRPGEIALSCTCPDHAVMCKHVAAVLYGVGARLDDRPELLFVLRAVDAMDLIGSAVPTTGAARTRATGLARGELSDIFGIEIDERPVRKRPKRVT